MVVDALVFLHKYADLFLKHVLEMKGVVGNLGEIKAKMNPSAIVIKKQPYRMNFHYKEHAK